jgi:hypothetical protein
MINREPIYAALFAKIATAGSYTTISRRLRHWNDVAPAEQPALFVIQRNETAAVSPGLNTKWTLKVDAYVYVHTRGDPTISPGSLINPLLDSVTSVFVPDDLIKNKCTLGGLVEHAWIDGTIETDEGILGDQGVAIVPITLLFA